LAPDPGGGSMIGGVQCKDAPVTNRVFRDAIMTVD
jgi:hypothetical protein